MQMETDEKIAMTLLMWAIDLWDDQNCNPKFSNEQMKALSGEIMCRVLPTLDRKHEIKWPPDNLTYEWLLEEIKKLPDDRVNL